MRERIIVALTELSYTRGFYKCTMDELANQAGMSKRTVYRYFHSKEAIIEAVLDQFMAAIASGIERIVKEGDNPTEMFAQLVKHLTQTGGRLINPLVLQDLRVHYPHFWRKIEAFRTEKIQHFIQSMMEDKGYVRNIRPPIFKAAFIASIQAVLSPDFILDHGLTFDDAAVQLVELFTYGLVGRKGT